MLPLPLTAICSSLVGVVVAKGLFTTVTYVCVCIFALMLLHELVMDFVDG